MRPLLAPQRKVELPSLPRPYSILYLVCYEYLFIYDIKKRKLVQKLKCSSFLAVSVEANDYVRVKLYDEKNRREGHVRFLPESACRKIAYEINAIIRHWNPGF